MLGNRSRLVHQCPPASGAPTRGRVGLSITGLLVTAQLVAVLIATSGCNTAARAPAQSAASPSASASVDPVTRARSTVELLRRGTFKPPDATPRPAAKGKKIAFLSLGQASPSSSIPAAGAVEAAAALGWQAQIYDMQLNPANAPKLVKDAVAAGVDGIITNFDCPLAAPEFAKAKAKGIKIVSLYAFDCDDAGFGGRGAPAFTSFINYGVATQKLGEFVAGFGALPADAIIAATDGSAKVINFTDPASTVLRYTDLGFTKRLAQCAGCQIVATVNFGFTDLGPSLRQKALAALREHPEANAIRTPYSSATLLGIAPAVVQVGRQDQLYIVGGEGLPPDLDTIRTDKGLQACIVSDSVWTGWAAVDTLNSHFIGREPRPAGLGTMLVDGTHNLPPSGSIRHNIDYRTLYKGAWGAG